LLRTLAATAKEKLVESSPTHSAARRIRVKAGRAQTDDQKVFSNSESVDLLTDVIQRRREQWWVVESEPVVVWRQQLTNGKPALARWVGGVETVFGSM
jgi:hypothetical protein